MCSNIEICVQIVYIDLFLYSEISCSCFEILVHLDMKIMHQRNHIIAFMYYTPVFFMFVFLKSWYI